MRKILSAICVALFCICSRADTNDVDLSEIEAKLDTISEYLSRWNTDISGNDQNGLRGSVKLIKQYVYTLLIYLNGKGSSPVYQRWESVWNSIDTTIASVDGKLSSVEDYLRLIEGDTQNAEYYIEQCYSELRSVSSMLSSCITYLSDIAYYAQSLPRIEDYQSALSVIVSNINDHILAGINVSIPNTINVNVQNPINFNPEWDFLSRTFQWSGWSFDNNWQQFATPDSQDNTLQGAAPMSIPATTTLAEYLERLYVGINNSGRILNDSIIHACFLLEGSNTVSQAEQEEVSDSVDSSVSNAPTKMEEVSSSIPTPSFGVDTSYIRRGLGFWDHVYNIQKPTSIILRTSPSDGDLISVPEINIEIKLSDNPALDKLLEFCRAVFTWLWWFLSVFFLIWLFKRGFALYTMVMGMLGPKPVQASPNDVI